MFALISCTKTQEVIEETYPGGSKKTVITYFIEEEDKEGKPLIRFKQKEIHYYENGVTEVEGSFDKQNRRQGEWSYWYPDGKLWSQGEYLNGKRDGKSTVWYENGQKRYQGVYLNDSTIGKWQFWDEQGKLIKEVTF